MALDYPEDLQYFDSHEYARLDGNQATIGITAYAIEQLGDVVYLELPEVGEEVTKGDRLGSYIVTGKQIGRASCRERVYGLV